MFVLLRVEIYYAMLCNISCRVISVHAITPEARDRIKGSFS